MAETQTGAHHEFQAEVNRILDIVVNSLYSKREVFLRELISNASDACDRLRYEAQLDGSLIGDDPDLSITVSLDDKTSRITVTDNGIGMSRDELVANLGTIAGSGTAKFAEQLAEAEKEKTKKERSDVSMIGQFGVGFYAVFMVAGSVTVTSRKAGSGEAWTWTSDGRTGFDVAEAPADTPRGTAITLDLKKDSKEFADRHRLETIIGTYSGHIGLPVWVAAGGESRQVNEAAALWTPAQVRHLRGGVHRVLPPCRSRLRRTLADAPQQGRGCHRLHEPALHSLLGALRPLRSQAPARRQALRPQGFHHR